MAGFDAGAGGHGDNNDDLGDQVCLLLFFVFCFFRYRGKEEYRFRTPRPSSCGAVQSVSGSAPTAKRVGSGLRSQIGPLVRTRRLFYGCFLQCGPARPAYASVLDLDLSSRMYSSSVDNPARKDPVSLGLPILPYVWLNRFLCSAGQPRSRTVDVSRWQPQYAAQVIEKENGIPCVLPPAPKTK